MYSQLSLVDSTSRVTTLTSHCGQDDQGLEPKDKKGEVLCFFVFAGSKHRIGMVVVGEVSMKEWR